MTSKPRALDRISKYANIRPLSLSTWQITYYNERVQRDVWAMPAGIVADYLRLTEAMALYGADLRMPHSRAMRGGLFELRPKGARRNWTGVLLHASGQDHCGAALVREENTRNTRRRNARGTQTIKGCATWLTPDTNPCRMMRLLKRHC